jgi:hypothetical protein
MDNNYFASRESPGEAHGKVITLLAAVARSAYINVPAAAVQAQDHCLASLEHWRSSCWLASNVAQSSSHCRRLWRWLAQANVRLPSACIEPATARKGLSGALQIIQLRFINAENRARGSRLDITMLQPFVIWWIFHHSVAGI